MYNRGWIYAKDICTETVSFISISAQNDPFSKNGEEIWYHIVFK